MSLARREILKATLIGLLVACAILGAFVLCAVLLRGEYTIDTDKFDADVEWGESVSLEGIEIIDNRTLGFLSMPLTRDKIVSIDDTEEAGRKKIVFVHNNREFTVYFDVKYKVEFLSYGEIIDTQRVFGKDELVPPVATPKTGYEFSHWDVDLSQELTGSIQVNAVFKEIEYPSLQGITATYGDTLGDVVLPSNEYGQWEFIYPSDTSVGDAGKQSFSVRFAFYEDDTYFKYGFVNIAVAQKQLEFTDVKDTFTYDGNEHFPTYNISEDVDVMVITSGSANTEVGVYEYSFEIVDRNYSGVYTGTYEIQKPTVTVKVSSATVTYPAAVPTFTYEVEGFENVELLGIKIDAPAFASQAGEFKIGITYTNNNVNYDIHKGTLTVLKGNLSVPTPEISVATFEDKLSGISFVGKYLGTWAWESPNQIIDKMDKVTAYAIFTHDDPNLNPVRMAIEITGIKKKTLSFNITGSTFTYEPGVERALIYNIVGGTNPDFDYNSIKVEGNYIPDYPAINAGTYRRTLVIDDYRYEGSTTVELKITPATPATDFTKVYERVWKEDLLLSSIELPKGYAWKNPGERISGAGEHSFAVIFTPTDTANYVTVDGQFTVNVKKANVEVVGVLDEYTKTYDTLEYNIKNSGIYARYTNGALTIKYYKDGTEIDKIVNAGTYKLVITVAEGDNYLGTTIEKTVTVERAENTQTVKTEQTATYLDSLGVLRLPLDNEGSWSWLETEIGNAGTKTFTAVYTPDENANYLPRTVSVKVTVLKKTVKAPSYSNTLLYNGKLQSLGLADTALYTVVDGGGIVNDTYSATLILRDPDNYTWETSDKSAIALEYRIVSVKNSWVVNPSISGWTYGDEPSKPSAQAKYGDYTVEYYTAQDVKVDGVPTSAGTYYARFTSEDENCSTVTADVKFVIAKRTVTAVPELSASTFVYTGLNQKPDVIGADLTLYSVTNNGGVNVGSYNVTLKLKDSANYRWSDVSGDTKNLTYSITKANAVISGLTIGDWTFGQSANAPTASTTFGNITYVYSATIDGEYTSTVPTTAGTYYVKAKVANSSNYDGSESEPVSFTIAKAAASITGLSATYTHTYNGAEFTVTGIGKNHGESNLVLKVNGEVVNTISVINAGTYEVEVILPESANYEKATATATITVNAADNTVDTVTTTQNSTYLNKLSTLTLPESTIGTWTWKDADENTTVGNAGTNTFIAVFTPSTTNYNAKEVEVTVNVAKKAIEIPIVSDKTYRGSNITSEYTVPADALYTITSDVGGTTVGSYSVTFTIKDEYKENYKWAGSDGKSASTSVTYNVTTATINIDTFILTVSKNEWSFGEAEAIETASKAESFGTVKIVYSTSQDGTYVSYEDLLAEHGTLVGTELRLNAGTYYVKAIVEAEDDSATPDWSYAETDYVSFTVKRASSTINGIKTGADSYKYEFSFDNTNSFGVTNGITLSHTELTGPTFTYYLDGGKVDAIYAPGTYTVVVSAVETTNFEAVSDEFTVTVSKIANDDDVTDDILNQTAIYGQSTSVIKVPDHTTLDKDGKKTGYWQLDPAVTTLGNVGNDKEFKLIFTPNDPVHYSNREITVKVDVTKKEVTAPTLKNTSLVYTANRQYAEFKADFDSSLYEILSNVGGINVAEDYSVTLKLIDPSNYKWKGESDDAANKTLYYDIIKADVDTTLPSYNATYGDLLSGRVLPTAPEGKWIWVDSEGNTLADSTKVGNAGSNTFYAKYVCEPAKGTTDVYNYNDSAVISVTVNVARLGINVPTLVTDNFIYGDAISLVLSSSTGVAEMVDNRPVGTTDVGSYSVTVKLDDNHKWIGWTDENGSDTADYTISYTVSKASAGDRPTLADDEFVFGEDLTLISTNGYYTVVDSRNGSDDVGDYTLTITLDNNYKWSDGGVDVVELSYSITKASVVLPRLEEDEFIYNDGVQKPRLTDTTDADLYTIVYVESENAGEYCVTITLKDNGKNHKWDDGVEDAVRELDYVIKKNDVDTNIGSFTATFGDLISSVTLPTAPEGKWIWVDSEGNALASTTKVGNAGSNTFYAKYVCDPAEGTTNVYNYNDSAVIPVTVDVARLGILKPTLTDNSFVFGDTISLGVSTVADVYTVTDNREGSTDAGEYALTVKLNDNYKWTDNGADETADVTLLYTITRKPIGNKPTTLSKNVFIYNETISFSISTTSFYTVTDNRKTTDVGNYSLTVSLGKNYKWSDTDDVSDYDISYSIIKAAIPVPDTSSWDFTFGNDINLGIATDEKYEISDSRDGSTNAGSYTVTLTIKDEYTKNYRWSDDVENGTRTTWSKNYTVKSYEPEINVTIDGWTFGDEPKTPVITITNCPDFLDVDMISVSYVDKDNKPVTISRFTPNGSYKVVITLAASDNSETPNWTSDTDEYEFSIATLEIPVPTVSATRPYDGGNHVGCGVPPTEFFSVNYNGNYTEVGRSYDVVFKLTYPQSSVWVIGTGDSATKTNEDQTRSYYISAAANGWLDTALPNIEDVIFNPEGTVITVEGKLLHGGYTVKFYDASQYDSVNKTFTGEPLMTATYDADGNPSGSTPTDAGDYVALYTSTDDHYETVDAVVDFTIERFAVKAPTLESNGASFDSNSHSTSIKHNDAWSSADPFYTWVDENGVLTSDGVIYAGDYDVVVTLNGNYKWEGKTGDAATADLTLTYSITKATYDPSVSIEGWTFNDSAKAPTPAGLPSFFYKNGVSGELDEDYKTYVSYYYVGTPNGSEENSYSSTNAPTQAGDYTVYLIVTATGNWDGITKESNVFDTFTIGRMTVPDVQLGAIVYNGTSQGINITDPNLNVLYKIDSQVLSTNADTTVSAVLRLLDKNNYQWKGTTAETITVSTIIGKADIIVNAPDIDGWIYEGVEQKPTPNFDESQEDFPNISSYVSYVFSTAPNGTYVSYIELLKDYGTAIDAETTLLNAGTYYVKAVVADTANWNGGTSAGYSTFTVDPYEVSLPEIDEDSFDLTYDGTEKDLGLVNEANGRYTVDNGTATDAGNHSAILTLKNSNYVWVDGRTDNKYDCSVDTEDAKIVKIPFTVKKFVFIKDHVSLSGTTSKYTETINITSELQNTELDDSVTVNVDLLYGVRVPTTYAITSENVEIRDDGYTYYWFDTIDELKATLGVSHLATDTYYVKTVIAASDNWDKFELIDEFEVIKMPLSTDIKQTSIPVYTGSELENIGLEGDLYTVTYPNKTDAGTYEATLTLNEVAALNYEWDCTWPAGTTDEEKLTIKIEYTIEKAEASITATNPAATPFKNGNFDFSDLIGATTDNTDVAKLLADSNYQIKSYTKIGASQPEADTPEVIFGAGTYEILITLAATDNFEAAEAKEVTVVISKATTAISGLNGGTPDYTGTDFFASIKNATTITVTNSAADAPDITWTVNGSVVGNDFTIINQGIYVIVASFAGNDNYEAATSATATLTVKDVETAIESITGIGGKSEYDGTGVVVEVTINHTFAVPVIKYYEQDETAVDGYRWLGEDTSGNAILPTNAGNYKVVVTVANDTDENWTTLEKEYFFNIGQKTITIGYVDEQLLSNLVYGNDNVSYDKVKKNLVLEGFVVINGNTVGILEGEEDDLVIYLTAQTGYPEEVKNAVDYKFVANFPGTRNYKAVVNQKVEFTVDRKPISVPTLTKSSFVFGETVSLETLFGTTTFVGYTPAIVSNTFNVGTNYEVTLTLDGNHKWDLGEGQYSTDVKTLYYNITAEDSSITVDNTEVNVDYKNDAYDPATIIGAKGDYTGAEVVYTITAYTKADGTVVSDLTDITLKDAGTYVVTVTLTHNDNYSDAEPVDVTVNIAKIDDSSVDALDKTQEATYGQTVSSVLTLPTSSIGKWHWADAEKNKIADPTTFTVGNAGTRTFWAVFTPDDAYLNNYNSKEIEVTVTVAKAQASIVVPDSKDFDGYTYAKDTDYYDDVKSDIVASNGTELDWSIISYKKIGATEVEGTTPTEIKNAGTYVISVVLNGDNNYFGDSKTITVTVNKGTAEIKDFAIADADKTWSYGEFNEEDELSASTNFGTVRFVYSTTGGNDYVDLTTFLIDNGTNNHLNAGTYYVKAVVDGTDNYYGDESDPINFTINKLTVTKPELVVPEYTGEVHTPEFKNPLETDYVKIIDVSEGESNEPSLYEATEVDQVLRVYVSLIDKVNYAWADGTIDDIVLEAKVIPATTNGWETEPTWTYTNPTGFEQNDKNIYGGTIAINVGAAIFDNGSQCVKYKLNNGEYSTLLPSDDGYVLIPSGVGTYTIIIETLELYSSVKATATLTVVIEPQPVELPTITAPTYTGSTVNGSVSVADDDLYTVSSNIGATNAGETVTIVLRLKDEYQPNYKWADGATVSGENSEFATITASILKADVTGITFSGATKTYANTEYSIAISGSLPTGVTVKYVYGENEYTGAFKATNVGVYTVKAVFTVTNPNYNDIAEMTATLTINQDTIVVNTPSIDDWTYGETAKTPSASVSDSQKDYPNISSAIKFEYSTAEDGEYSDAVPTNAGTYYVRAYVETSDNWIGGTSAAKQFTISKLKLEEVMVSQNDVFYMDISKTNGISSSNFNITYAGDVTYDNIPFVFTISESNGGFEELNVFLGDKTYLPVKTYYVKITVDPDGNYDFVSIKTISVDNGENKETITEQDHIVVEFTVQKATPELEYVFINDPAQSPDTLYENLVILNSGTLDTNGDRVGDTRVATVNGTTLTGGTWQLTNIVFNGSDSGYIVTYTPADTTNFNTVKYYRGTKGAEATGVVWKEADATTQKLTLKPVAAIGNPVKTLEEYTDSSVFGATVFGTIEEALENAESGNTVWVVADNTGYVQIKSSITINSGVTVILPYDTNGDTAGGDETNTIASDGSIASTLTNADNALKKESTYCTTIVKVNDNCSITVKGKLIISGQLSGGSGGSAYAGQTAGYYAKIELYNESSIIVDGDGIMHVVGLIDDKSSSTTPSSVEIKSGGTMFEPFVVRDFKGGSLLLAIYKGIEANYEYSPFNQFQFINVTSKVVINYGGSLHAYANLYATQHNTTLGNIVGNTENCVVQLSEDSKLEAKYNIGTDITDIRIYGGASTHALSLNLKSLGISISSNQFVFPLSWLFNITLDRTEDQKNNEVDANYYLNQSFKMLPGSVLTIAEGVKVEVKGALSVYSENFVDKIKTGQYPQKGAAMLTVNGTLVAEELGGKVYTSNATGRVSVTAGNTKTVTYEPTASTGSVMTAEVTDHYEITLPLELCSIDGTSISGISSNIEYYTVNGIWQGSSTGIAQETIEEIHLSDGCVTPDTLITLADGTQVRVDSLKGDEMLLVWNLETGKLDFAPIMFIDSEFEAEVEVIYLHFSDGTIVKVIYEHGFWDYDLNKYVYLDRNAADYIGHYFAKQNGDELIKVQLVDVEIKTELTTAWSPVTVGHLCYFVNGMLSMPGGVGGLFNIFEVDEETMTYDYEAIAKDIETYGLFTYEELNAICPLSEEMFNAAGGAYLKISIGKGNLTMEELIAMINRYSVYFE